MTMQRHTRRYSPMDAVRIFDANPTRPLRIALQAERECSQVHESPERRIYFFPDRSVIVLEANRVTVEVRGLNGTRIEAIRTYKWED